ncbi:Hypothetical predicted protein [Octopus vulgaris]|uniref:Uncharacterized protein n=1 Tax=Octopus vulgaris TaxID=6645 RepID=A0AA36B4H8_OCTVU|nr:Hypothetical predicted protein [Octopus vulgaris]
MKEKRQEKGKASAMKEKESKEKETTGKEQKKQKREKAENELKKKPSILSLFGLEKDAPTVKENVERKKREREKLRVENKEAASPKKKTREHSTETTVLKWGHRFYGDLVIYKKCPEMDETIGRTRKTSWFKMRTEIEAGALVHEDSFQGFMEAAENDKATFYVNGEVNRQNRLYWSRGNPHWMDPPKQQGSKKVMVWCVGLEMADIKTLLLFPSIPKKTLLDEYQKGGDHKVREIEDISSLFNRHNLWM